MSQAQPSSDRVSHIVECVERPLYESTKEVWIAEGSPEALMPVWRLGSRGGDGGPRSFWRRDEGSGRLGWWREVFHVNPYEVALPLVSN